MKMNLKYSDNPVGDYRKLSIGRKLYIEKRAIRNNVSVPLGSKIWAIATYLMEKYGDNR